MCCRHTGLPWTAEGWPELSLALIVGPSFLHHFSQVNRDDRVHSFPGPLCAVQLLLCKCCAHICFCISCFFTAEHLPVSKLERMSSCISAHTLLITVKILFSSASGAVELLFHITVLLGTDLIRALKPAK